MIMKSDDLFFDLYFSYVNVPTIGRDILDDEEFDRLINKELEPGENALCDESAILGTFIVSKININITI